MNVIYCFFAELLCKKNHGGVRRGAFGRRLSFVALTLGVLFCAFFSCVTVYAEGSREIVLSTLENYKALGHNDDPEKTDSTVSRWTIRSDKSGTANPFVGVKVQQKFKFYAYENEVVYLASNCYEGNQDAKITYPSGKVEYLNFTNTQGYIENVTVERKGPNGVRLPKSGVRTPKDENDYDTKVTGGYNAYQLTADQSGIYEVEFYSTAVTSGKTRYTMGTFNNSTNNRWGINSTTEGGKFKSANGYVHAWDITVTQNINGEPRAVNGRVWADAYSLEIAGQTYASVYAATRDGYIWKFGLNGCEPNTISFYSNSRGNIGSGTNASAYHSVHSPIANYTSFDFYKNLKDKNGNPDGVYILGPDNEVTDIDSPYHMFFNYPDTSMPESIILTKPKDPGKITSLRYDGRTGEDTEDEKNEDGYSGVGGYFEIETDGVSSYQIVIDMSNMYAKKYHKENKESNNCSDVVAQEDAICLSTDTDDNFIYYNKEEDKWYSIRTKDRNNRHPSNEKGENPDVLIIYAPITEPDLSQYKSLGKVMLGNAAVDGKTDRIKWNGRDHYGRILPIGTYFGNTGRGTVYAQSKAGEIHFPLCDVEYAKNGFSIWLENAPEWMKKKPDESGDLSIAEQVDARSKLYYNHLDESLLRDFYRSDLLKEAGNGAGLMAWVWNLPKNISNDAAGQKVDNASEENLGRKWVTGDPTFEDKSLDGVPSYKYEGKTGTVEERKPTGTAAVATNNGIDHGIDDIWSYAISNKETDKFYLKDEIQLDNYANHRIITGFVYLDTPKVGNGNGVYDKTTDDRELPLAEVTAKYGKKTSSSGLIAGIVSRILGDDTVVYETTTNTNGYYSIPINKDYFDGSGSQEVEITVKYIDPNRDKKEDNSHTAYKVTTLGKKSGAKYEQVSGGAANISVQTIDLSKVNENLREIYADSVGYTYSQSKNILIEDKWTPAALRDITLKSKFKVVGVLNDVAKAYTGGDTTPEEIEAKNKYFEDNAFIVPISELSVEAAMGGIFSTKDLPGCTFKPNGDKDQDIVYRVIQIKEGTYDTTIRHEVDKKYYADEETLYDYWLFENSIVPSTFIETVWYDANQNGSHDEDEKPIEGAIVTIAKRNETTQIYGGDEEGESRYYDAFEHAPDYKSASEVGDLKRIGNSDVLETDVNGQVELNGMIAGHYRVTVSLPEGSVYNSATKTSDGELDANGTIEASETAAKVTQYIDIGVGKIDESSQKAEVGYGFMGGLGIKKIINIAGYSPDETIQGYIQNELFRFELQLKGKPQGTEEGDKVKVTTETFNTNITTGAEGPAEDGDKVIDFTQIDGTDIWKSDFELKSGERITIPNIKANTEYSLWEYDNNNNTSSEEKADKNGSSTETDNLTYMPKGYSLANIFANNKYRYGSTPITSRTVFINYVNEYKPIAVEGYGSDGSGADSVEDGSGGNKGKFDKYDKDKNIDKGLEIKAKIKIESTAKKVDGYLNERKFEEGDKFKLLLEPVDDAPAFSVSGGDKDNKPGKSIELSADDENIGKEILELAFDDGTYAEFTTEKKDDKGETQPYSYILREARPFYDDFYTEDNDKAAIPGLTYSTEQYRMDVYVKDIYQQLEISEVKWYKQNGDGGWKELTDPANEIVFTNTFNPYNISIPLTGTKVLNTEVKDVGLEDLPPFSFNVELIGRRLRNSEKDEWATCVAPVPSKVDGSGNLTLKVDPAADPVRSATIDFGSLTFSEKDAGEDVESAMLYKYKVVENEPSEDYTKGERKDGVVYDQNEPRYIYIRVYKVLTGTDDGQVQTINVEMCDEDGRPLDTAGESLTFTNSYSAETTFDVGVLVDGLPDLGLKFKKTVEGKYASGNDRGILEGDNFRFMIEPVDGAPTINDKEGGAVTNILEYTAKKDIPGGSVILPNSDGEDIGATITFTQTGEYIYNLRELNPLRDVTAGFNAIPGITYDNRTYRIYVNVENAADKDDGKYKGNLTAEITKVVEVSDGKENTVYEKGVKTPDDSENTYGIVFTNIYNSEEYDVQLRGQKVLESSDPTVDLLTIAEENALEDGFSFKLTAEGRAQLKNSTVETAPTDFKPYPDQPMPDGLDGEGAKTVHNIIKDVDGSVISSDIVDFGSIKFTLEDGVGATENTPYLYRYLVDEDEKEMEGIKGVTPVDPEGKVYVYYKVYTQKVYDVDHPDNDDVDHIVVTRCNEKGESLPSSEYEFTVTNKYTAGRVAYHANGGTGVGVNVDENGCFRYSTHYYDSGEKIPYENIFKIEDTVDETGAVIQQGAKSLIRKENQVVVGWSIARQDKVFAEDPGYLTDGGVLIPEDYDGLVMPEWSNSEEPKNLTIYVVWAEDNNNNMVPDYNERGVINYKDNTTAGAEEVFRSQSVLQDNDETLLKETPTASEYLFLGWTKDKKNTPMTSEPVTDPEKSGEAGYLSDFYLPGAVFHTGQYDETSDKTKPYVDELYAVWANDYNGDGVADYYQVRYDAGEVAGLVDSMPTDNGTYRAGELVSISETEPKWAGHVFMGWKRTNLKAVEDENLYLYDATINYFSKSDELDVLTAQWETDELGGEPSGGDGIPDRYQKKITFNVVGGTWDDGETTKTIWVPLKDEDGNYSIDGSGTYDIPESTPYEGFEGGSWGVNVPDGTAKNTSEMTYVYTYDPIIPEVWYNSYSEGMPPSMTEEPDRLPYGHSIKIDPDGGTWKGDSEEKTLGVTENITLDDPVWEGHMFMGFVSSKNEEEPAEPENLEYTYTAQWLEDENNDNIPDVYQKKVTFEVENGTWVETGNSDPITKYAELKDVYGKWSASGSGTVTAPEPQPGAEMFGGSWEPYFSGTVTGSDPITYTYTYYGKDSILISYNRYTEGRGISADSRVSDPVSNGDNIQLDLSEGEWAEGVDISDKIENITENKDIPDPIKDGCVFLGWKKETGTDGCRYKYTAMWEEDKNGDNIPDRYQKAVTFNVVNGTWSNDRKEPITVYAELKENGAANGAWSESGSGTVDVPTGMKPDEGFDKGAWDKGFEPVVDSMGTATAVVTGSEPEEFTYTFDVKRYRVIYDLSEGRPAEDKDAGYYAPEDVPVNSEINLKDAPVRDGYIFISWRDSIVNTVQRQPGDSYTVTADVVFFAEWEPDRNNDGILDKYQKMVKFTILNGYWDSKDARERLYYVTLLDNDGNPSVNGKATLGTYTDDENVAKGYVIPDVSKASPEYDPARVDGEGKWLGKDPTGYVIDNKSPMETIFTYAFIAEIEGYVNIFYNEFIQDGGRPRASVQDIQEGRTISVVLGGGSGRYDDKDYKDYTSAIVLTANGDINLEDPTRDGYVFMGWEKKDGTEGVEYSFEAIWRADTNKDGIPDMYQKVVTLQIRNGNWNVRLDDKYNVVESGGTEYTNQDIVEWVELFDDATARWSQTGSGSLPYVPSSMTPDSGYASGDWITGFSPVVTGNEPVTYTFVYYPIGDRNVTYNEYVEGRVPEGAVDTVDANNYIVVDPKGNLKKPEGGSWTDPDGGEHSTDETEIYIKVDDNKLLANPTMPGYLFMGWKSEALVGETHGDDDESAAVEYRYTAQWEPDVTGGFTESGEPAADGVPDRYQKLIIFNVVNGKRTDVGIDHALNRRYVWETVEHQYVDLTDGDGKWSESGSATVIVPKLMVPNERYVNSGDWTNKSGGVITLPPEVINGDTFDEKNNEFTFTFHYGGHKVEYDLLGGTAVAGTESQYEEKILAVTPPTLEGKAETVMPPAPTRADNVFEGWEVVAEDGAGKVYQPGDSVTITKDTNFKAKWTDDINNDGVADKYQKKITYHIENGTWSDGTKEDLTEYVNLYQIDGRTPAGDGRGKLANVPAGMRPDEGYVLGRWDVSDLKNGYVVSGNTDLTFTYSYIPDSFTLEYDLNDGEGKEGEDYSTKRNLRYLQRVYAAAAPTLTGKSFMGWSDDINTYYPGDEVIITGNTVLTAKWSDEGADKNTYIIEYYTEGLNGRYVKADGLTKEQEDFVGAYVTADTDYTGTERYYEFNKELSEISGIVTGAGRDKLTLKLYYSRMTYDVNYDLNDGEPQAGYEYPEEKVKYGGSINMPVAPIRDGYTFSGWCLSKDGNGRLYDPGESVEITNDCTYYAVWKENERSLIIQVFDDYNNDGVYGGEGAIVAVPVENIRLYKGEETDPIAENIGEHRDGGGVVYEKLSSGEYRIEITIDGANDMFDRFTGVGYALGGEIGSSDAAANLTGGTLKISHSITLPSDNYNGVIRYGITRPYDVIYNLNGAPSTVDFREGFVPDSDYAYHEGDGEYYTDGARTYDGIVSLAKASDIVGFNKGDDVYVDAAGVEHRFLGWSTKPDAEEADDGLITNGSGYCMPEHNLEVYAVWDDPFNDVMLRFDANDGAFSTEGGAETVWPEGTLNHTLRLGRNTVINLNNEPEGDIKTYFPRADEITRDKAVFVGWTLTKISEPVTDYATIKDALIGDMTVSESCTVYAVWAKDVGGRLVDINGVGCDKINSDDHEECAHGDLIYHESDGIPDYQQVFYDINLPVGITADSFGGSLSRETSLFDTNGKRYLSLDDYTDSDRNNIYAKDKDVPVGKLTERVYIRSSSLKVKNYAFMGWCLNDPSGNSDTLRYAGSGNTLGNPYKFDKSPGRNDTLYAIWRPVTAAVVTVRLYDDKNGNREFDLRNEDFINNFEINDIMEVTISPDAAGYTDPTCDDTNAAIDAVSDYEHFEDTSGQITISGLEPLYYEFVLTLKDREDDGANERYVLRPYITYSAYAGDDIPIYRMPFRKSKSGDSYVDYDGNIIDINEEENIRIRYNALEGASGVIYVPVTEGYSVSYDRNGAPETTVMPETQTRKYKDDVVTVDDLPGDKFYTDDNGVKHEFMGWSTEKHDNEAEFDSDSTFTMEAGDVTLYAVWSEESYKVNYYINDVLDTDETNVVDKDFRDRSYSFGDTAALWMPKDSESLPERTDEKAVFVGWTDDETKADEIYAEIPPVGTLITSELIPNGDVNVYAVWAEDIDGDNRPDYADDMHLVKYHSNGGFPAPADGIFFVDYTQYRLPGQSADILSVEEGKQRVQRDGAVLVGFGTDRYDDLIYDKATEEKLAAESVVFENEDIIVFALWAEDKNGDGTPDYDEDTYIFRYNANGGDGVVPDEIGGLLNGESVSISSGEDLIPPAGSVFVGWSLNRYESLAVQPPTDLLDSIYTVDAENDADDDGIINAYAVWAADADGDLRPDYSQVVYDKNTADDVEGMPTDSNRYETGDRVTVSKNVPERENYVFAGWRLNSSNMIYDGNSAANTFTKNRFLDTLYALWENDINGDNIPDKNQRWIRYDLNGGQAADGISYDDRLITVGESVAAAGAPSRDKYTFTSWKDADGNEYAPGVDIVVEKDITLTAQWLPDQTPLEPISSAYKVLHYLQQPDGTYELYETEFPLFGETGTVVRAVDKAETGAEGYEGFRLNEALSTVSGTVSMPVTENGELVVLTLNMYYDIAEDFNVRYDLSGGTPVDGVDYSDRTVKRGEDITILPAPSLEGKKFSCYRDGSGREYKPGDITAVTRDMNLKAIWDDDINGDDIPDKFQRHIIFNVVGGIWSDGSVSKDIWVNLYAGDGTSYDENGRGRYTPPTDYSPLNGYEGGRWDDPEPSGVVNADTDAEVVYVYRYTPMDGPEIDYNKEPEGGNDPEPDRKPVVYNDIIIVNPNGGDWIAPDGTIYSGYETAVIEITDEEIRISDPEERDDFIFVGWRVTEGKAGSNIRYIFTAVWEIDRDSDGIPDKYQKSITFRVINGTWADGSREPISVKVSLTADGTANGKWSETGYADISGIIPENMKPDENFGHGAWIDEPAAKVRGTDAYTYTYIFYPLDGSDIEYKQPDPSGGKDPEINDIPVDYGSKVEFVSEGGLWTDPNGNAHNDADKGFDVTVEISENNNLKVEDPVWDGHKFMGWDVQSGEGGADLIFRAKWAADSKGGSDPDTGDGIPDNCQRLMIFKVENGSWSDGTTDPIEHWVTLYDKGLWSDSGDSVGIAEIPYGMEPFDGYEGGSWYSQPPVRIGSDFINGTEYTYGFTEIIDQFEVSYDPNGGTPVDGVDYGSFKVKDGSVIKALPAPVYDSHVFTGWSDGERVYKPGDEITVTKDIVLTAVWDDDMADYKVCYLLEKLDGSYECVDEVIRSGIVGSEVTAEEKEYEGYALNRELSVVSGRVYTNFNEGEGDLMLTLRLYYDLDGFAVSYDLKGGIPVTGAEYDRIVKGGDSITIAPMPELSDYVFMGWSFKGSLYQPGETFVVNEDTKFVARWEIDVKGGGPDGIPDRYQKWVIFKVLNGTWDGGGKDDISHLVQLFDEFGNWSENGSAVVEVPSGMNPDYGYEGGDWIGKAPDMIESGSALITGSPYTDAVYTYGFGKIDNPNISYNEANDGRFPAGADVEVNYGAKVRVDPNGGVWRDCFTPTDLVIEQSCIFEDPERDEYVFMGWERDVCEEEGIDWIFTAQWYADKYADGDDPDKPDGVPDIYQKRIYFDVVNGTWDGHDNKEKYIYVTLTLGGVLDTNGSAILTAPEGMVPDYGYTGGSWDVEPPLVVSGRETEKYTYTFEPFIVGYKTEHYLQKLDGSYELESVDSFSAQVGSRAEAEPKTYEHYKYNTSKSYSWGNVDEDGSLKFMLYYDLNTYKLGYDLNGGSAVAENDYSDEYHRYSEEITVKAAPERSGYVFNGWNNGTKKLMPGDKFVIAGDTVLAASWLTNGGSGGGGGGGATVYRLTYVSNGGTEYPSETYSRGTEVRLNKVPERVGYSFTGWYSDAELKTPVTSVVMDSDKRVYAGWSEVGGSGYGVESSAADVPDTSGGSVPSGLNGSDHMSYISGYGDGTVRPNADISRAEVAMIFFRLLNEDLRNEHITSTNSFNDVSENAWYAEAVSTLSALDIIYGRDNGGFDPNAPVTRAEFAAICARFDSGAAKAETAFDDISGHWAEAEINRAAARGWISGYGDGSFRPENNITRAESVSLINRVLKRIPESEEDLLDGMITFTDNADKNSWYYIAVQEAANSHDYTLTDDAHEKWTSLGNTQK